MFLDTHLDTSTNLCFDFSDDQLNQLQQKQLESQLIEEQALGWKCPSL